MAHWVQSCSLSWPLCFTSGCHRPVVVPQPACSYVQLCVGCFGDGTAEWTRETNWNQGAEVGVRGRAVSLLGADKGEKYVNFIFNDHWGRMDVI